MNVAGESTAAASGPAVVRAADALARLRARIAKQHAEQGLGYATCGLATDLFDAIVIDVWQAALAGPPRARRPCQTSLAMASERSVARPQVA